MSLLSLLIALAGSTAQPELAGRYEAVTESEYGISLTLTRGGKAELQFRSWEAGESDSEYAESLKGSWRREGQTVVLALKGGHSARYSLTPCLSYAEFGAQGCSAGLKLLETTLPAHYDLDRFGLWRADSLKVGP